MSDRFEFDIILPTFPVEDVLATAKFYAEQLGFEITMMEGDCYAHVKRGKAVIALYRYAELQERSGCESFSPPTPARATIFIEGINELFEQYKANNITILDVPTEVPYGWDMQIADCDGHILEFVQFHQS